MTTKGNKPPLVLDMPFKEALERFAQTDPAEMKVGPSRKKKKPAKSGPKNSSG